MTTNDSLNTSRAISQTSASRITWMYAAGKIEECNASESEIQKPEEPRGENNPTDSPAELPSKAGLMWVPV
jgi:hypothetical protein